MADTVNYRQTIARALADALEEDPRVIFFGEDVGAAGGAFKTTVGLFDRFGGERVRDTPISEQAIVGTALGAAITGLRPVADLMFADFAGVAFDQIVNQVAKYRYMSNGELTVPLTILMANGAGAGFAAQHSQSTENWFLNVPGLKIAVPATVEDLYGLVRSAVRDDNPVIIMQHKNLFALKGSVSNDESAIVPLGKAAVVRTGGDVTIVATQQMRHRAVGAAEQLAGHGIEATVIDPRTLVPFDDATVVESLAQTSRLAVVQEGPPAGSWGASLVSRIVCQQFELLDAPPLLLSGDETPVSYAAAMEELYMPTVDRIATDVEKLCRY